MAAADEQRELALVDKLDFRILNVANDETKLQELLTKFLAPLILKTASPNVSVVAKTVQILTRIKTYVQPPGVVLPVAKLIEQFKTSESRNVKQFDLVFIRHSLLRLDVSVRQNLFPMVTKGISRGDPNNDSPSDSGIFEVFMSLLLDAKLPSRGSIEDDGLRESLGLDDDDAHYLCKWLGKVLLLKPAGADNSCDAFRKANPSPTFSAADLDFLVPPHQTQVPAPFAVIAALKLKIVQFLATKVFSDKDRLMPALYAACSPDSRISTIGDELLKKSTVDLEDAAVVEALFAAHAQLSPRYQIRILGLLSHSKLSTTMDEEISAAAELSLTPELALPPALGSVQPRPPKVGINLERSKLHRALFQYLRWVASVGATRDDFAGDSRLLERMRKYIEDQGWPKPTNKLSSDEIALRSAAYEILGIMGKTAVMSMTNQLVLTGFMFRSLVADPLSEVVASIEEALSLLSGMFPRDAHEGKTQLRALLLRHMQTEVGDEIVRTGRYTAVKWANRCLPFSDIRARWINILAVGGRLNERHDVVEEGLKGLDPWAQFAHSGTTLEFPDWKIMLRVYFSTKIEAVLDAGGLLEDGFGPKQNDAVDANFQGDSFRAFPMAINYCKQMMFLAALKDFKMDPDWERNLESKAKTDLPTKSEIRRYLSHDDHDRHVPYTALLLRVCREGMASESLPIAEACAKYFVEVASVAPKDAIAYQAEHALKYLPLVTANNQDMRVLASEAFGVVASHPANSDKTVDEMGQVLADLFKDAETKTDVTLNAAEGAILAYSHLCSRLVFMGRELPSGLSPQLLLDMFAAKSGPASLQLALLEAVTELWTAALTSSGDITLSDLAKTALESSQKSEKEIVALGRLSMAIDDEPDSGWDDGIVGEILKGFFALHTTKEAQVLFTIGEAIAAAVACWDADCVKLCMNVDSPGGKFRKPARTKRLTGVLDKLIDDCKDTKPSLLKASGIWLFHIVQYCSHLDVVKAKLRQCQGAFMRLLSTRDELTQEAAARGLSLVYEKGDAETREQLTMDLVNAFTGTGTKIKVEHDTELFDAGSLPVGEGKSITSYKDIVSLASEVGDQTLVYKFMALATNAATWNTRSAFGRFGLSSILAESDIDPKIYPKLYRYRFDPNSNVQKSMDDLWKSIVKDPNAVLEEHFDTIMEDLLSTIVGKGPVSGQSGKEWRVREACCGAIADLIQGRPFPKYEAYYQRIWTVAMKLLDDIKGSVRNAALRLCMGLTNTLTRLMEESQGGSQVQGMLKEVVPFLLSDNIVENKAKEVQSFGIVTLLKVSKKGGRHLRPYLPQLIPKFLQLLTSIEPGEIGMYYQKLGESDRGTLDRARASAVNQSPISEAIDNLLRFVDTDSLAVLVPEFEKSVKAALGMPTKIGCSRVLTSLFTSHRSDMGPHAGRFLQLMERTILDMNDEASKAYARATAYIMRVAPDVARQKFVVRLVELYYNAEDEVRRRKVGDAVLALGKTSPDVFTALESYLLPFSFLAQHDVDDYVSKCFKTVWEQHAGSSRTAGRYVEEIAQLVRRGLDTAKWGLRHTAAFTIAALATALANATEATGAILEANLRIVWPVFDDALALKTFDGKEKLLEAFPTFVAKAKALLSDDKTRAQLKKIAVREAKRNNLGYKVHAFRCLWRFAEASGLDVWDDVVAITEPVLHEYLDKDAMDVDEDADGKKVDREELAGAALEAIARGYDRKKMEAASYQVLTQVLTTLTPYLSSAKFAAIKRKVWYPAVAALMDASEPAPGGKKDESGAAGLYLLSLDPDLVETGTESQRTDRAKGIAALVRAQAKGVFGPVVPGQLQQFEVMIKEVLGKERSMPIRDILKKVLEELQK